MAPARNSSFMVHRHKAAIGTLQSSQLSRSPASGNSIGFLLGLFHFAETLGELFEAAPFIELYIIHDC
jgi:hypothetical protein